MSIKHNLKVLFRSRSWDFMQHCRLTRSDGNPATYQWRGKTIHYRPGTNDCRLIYEILLSSQKEYDVPEGIRPQNIIDIGANIGIASIFFVHRFPCSRIFAFEPAEGNFSILERNTAPYDNIRVFPTALGSRDEEKDLFFSDNPKNYGGFSFFPEGSNTVSKRRIRVRKTAEYFREIGITQVDLLKIDTEGSEFDILTSLNPAMLKKVTWVVGELHGVRDFEVLAYLDQWFDLSLKRSFRKRLFMFRGLNKNSGCEIT